MNLIKLKPLSVNKQYQGKRFKTPEYKVFCEQFKKMITNEDEEYYKQFNKNDIFHLKFEFGFSTFLSDCSNAIKSSEDLIVHLLGKDGLYFDDNQFFECSQKKVIVKKGEEYIKFELIKIGIRTDFNCKLVDLNKKKASKKKKPKMTKLKIGGKSFSMDLSGRLR